MILNRKEILSNWANSLSPSDLDEWLKVRRACARSLFYFVKDCGGASPKSGGDISSEIHKIVLDRWQDPKMLRQAVFMPRFWRKSTMCTIWANLWEYLQNPEIRILITSEKQETAALWVKQIGAQVRGNQRLRWVYPELQMIDNGWCQGHRWSGDCLEFPRNGIYPEATISCIGIRGAAQGLHFDLISGDDIVGEKGMESDLVLQDAIRWFDNIEELLINPSMNSEEPSRCRFTGTHWSPGDFGEYVQEKYPEYQWYIVPCRHTLGLPEKENITYLNNPNVEDGESNFAAGGTTEHYIAMSANPAKEMQYWAQHMNLPTGASKMTKFDYNWLRWYTIEKRANEQGVMEEWVVCDDDTAFPLDSIPKVGFIDPGGFAERKLLSYGSRNASMVCGQPMSSIRKFVFEAWAVRLKETKDFLDPLFNQNERWKPRVWRIEVIAAQKYLMSDIKAEQKRRDAKAEEDNTPKGRRLMLAELPPAVGKDAKDGRITSLIDSCSRGEYFFHRSFKDLISEYKSYPGGLTRDLMDLLGWFAQTDAKRSKPEGFYRKKEAPRKDEGPTEDGRSEATGY